MYNKEHEKSIWLISFFLYRPHGKESTEVQITQNIRKESENSYQKFNKSQ